MTQLRELIEDNGVVLNRIPQRARSLHNAPLRAKASKLPSTSFMKQAAASIVGTAEFSFDDEVVTAAAYRRVMTAAKQNESLPAHDTSPSPPQEEDEVSLAGLTLGTSLSNQDPQNVKKFLMAVSLGNHSLVKQMISQGIDLEGRDAEECTALHRAAIRNDSQMIEILILTGSEVQPLNGNGLSPLHLAAIGGRSAREKGQSSPAAGDGSLETQRERKQRKRKQRERTQRERQRERAQR